MSNIKKRDDEKAITLAVCGLFSGALLVILLTSGNLFEMGFLLSIAALVSIAACAYSWYVLIKNIDDPNYNYWRFLCIAFAIIAIIVIMGHRSGWMENKQVKSDSAIEQAKP
jgi:uncharacterized membrane protein